MKTRTSFRSGKRHPRWSGGKCLNSEGYIRFSAGEHRHKLEHVVVIEKLLEAPISYMFPPGSRIPKGLTIHHCDHNRTHNCIGNLMLLGKLIHDAISRNYRAYIMSHYDEYVSWMQKKYDEEVPF